MITLIVMEVTRRIRTVHKFTSPSMLDPKIFLESYSLAVKAEELGGGLSLSASRFESLLKG